MTDPAPLLDLSSWPAAAKALGLTLGGAGSLAVLTKVIDTLWPSAAQRLQAGQERQQSDRNRVRDLEALLDQERRDHAAALDAATSARYAEREAHLRTLEHLVLAEAALERLSLKLGLPAVFTAEDAEQLNAPIRDVMREAERRYRATHDRPSPEPPAPPADHPLIPSDRADRAEPR